MNFHQWDKYLSRRFLDCSRGNGFASISIVCIQIYLLFDCCFLEYVYQTVGESVFSLDNLSQRRKYPRRPFPHFSGRFLENTFISTFVISRKSSCFLCTRNVLFSLPYRTCWYIVYTHHMLPKFLHPTDRQRRFWALCSLLKHRVFLYLLGVCLVWPLLHFGHAQYFFSLFKRND